MRTMWDDYSHNLRYEKDFEHIIADVLKGQIDNSGIPSITDEDPTMEGKTCFEVTTRAAQWGNQISSEAKEKIAKKIQESLKKRYNPEDLPVTMFSILDIFAGNEYRYPILDGFTKRHIFYFHYFSDKLPERPKEDGKYIKHLRSDFIEHDVNQPIGLSIYPKIKYKNYYKNDDVVFDKKYVQLMERLNNAQSGLYKAQERLHRAKGDLDTFSIGACIGSSIWSLAKTIGALAISFIIFFIIWYLFSAFSWNEQIGVVLGIIVGIIVFIPKWENWELGAGFEDFGMHFDAKRDCSRAKQEIKRYKDSIANLENSEEFKTAKENDERLRKEDMEFAEKWHKIWYDKCMSSPLFLHYSVGYVAPSTIRVAEADRIEYQRRQEAYDKFIKELRAKIEKDNANQ